MLPEQLPAVRYVICVTKARRGDTDCNLFHSDCYVALRRYLLPATSQGILIKPEQDLFHTDEAHFQILHIPNIEVC